MASIILFNKPYQVLCQFTDTQGRPTLADYIPQSGVYPAGRLDYDSEGLMILTDDGQMQHQISNPKAKMAKTYWVQVEGHVTDADLDILRSGVTLKDGICRPALAKVIDEPDLWPRTPPIRDRKNIPTHWLEITISEGRNRQIRRMTAAIGYPTLRLIRAAIGPWQLNELQPGQHQPMSVHSPAKKTNPKIRRHTKKRR